MAWVIAAVVLGIGAWLLFRDTMNRFQAIFCLRVYWITRDTGKSGDPHIRKAWMRQDSAPFWRGNGVEFRLGRHTFQVGKLTEKGKDLQDQISSLRDFDPPVKEIRQWQ